MGGSFRLYFGGKGALESAFVMVQVNELNCRPFAQCRDRRMRRFCRYQQLKTHVRQNAKSSRFVLLEFFAFHRCAIGPTF